MEENGAGHPVFTACFPDPQCIGKVLFPEASFPYSRVHDEKRTLMQSQGLSLNEIKYRKSIAGSAAETDAARNAQARVRFYACLFEHAECFGIS